MIFALDGESLASCILLHGLNNLASLFFPRPEASDGEELSEKTIHGFESPTAKYAKGEQSVFAGDLLSRGYSCEMDLRDEVNAVCDIDALSESYEEKGCCGSLLLTATTMVEVWGVDKALICAHLATVVAYVAAGVVCALRLRALEPETFVRRGRGYS